ncbi:hypothetical protein EDD53_1358 [Pacificibacter maritimus]|uniref:Lipoprotein n=1 Tax=Pacificibacter maritimus TaxID=762213 RepID=A0A3N4UI97_9RHOB|nr:hypothetical protein [Pacificibacter maritimus]RPE66959.1 hypothetical protein EDD53_1358 [Pacificibacter maritimus]
MKTRAWILGGSALMLAACTQGYVSDPETGFLKEVPEDVRALAAPNQDLASVRIDPVDGCYVYRHVGPVETTFLPLRTANDAPICSRAPDAAPA